MRYHAIIFDMDGVIFDTIPYARQDFMEMHPGLTADMYNQIHLGNYHEEAKKYAYLKVPETEDQREQRRIEYFKLKSGSKSFKGIKELLMKLHISGFILTLNTNAGDEGVLPLLKNNQLNNIFDFIATSRLTKDKVEKFKIITEKYGVNRKDILFITDALGDVRDADKADIPTVAVSWGVHNGNVFKAENHHNLLKIIDSVNDLDDFIHSYFQQN